MPGTGVHRVETHNRDVFSSTAQNVDKGPIGMQTDASHPVENKRIEVPRDSGLASAEQGFGREDCREPYPDFTSEHDDMEKRIPSSSDKGDAVQERKNNQILDKNQTTGVEDNNERSFSMDNPCSLEIATSKMHCIDAAENRFEVHDRMGDSQVQMLMSKSSHVYQPGEKTALVPSTSTTTGDSNLLVQARTRNEHFISTQDMFSSSGHSAMEDLERTPTVNVAIDFDEATVGTISPGPHLLSPIEPSKEIDTLPKGDHKWYQYLR